MTVTQNYDNIIPNTPLLSADPNDKDKWILDEEAAPVVKRIFDLCIGGKGPEQISRILERD